MDFQQRRKEAIKSEFAKLNKWDEDSGLTVKQQRMETAERMVREKEKQNSAFKKELANHDFDRVSVFGTAAGEPVQEISPAKKAKCRSRQDRQMGGAAREAIRRRGEEGGTRTALLQERVDGTSYQIQRSIEKYIVDLEGNMVLHREVQDRPDYAAMKYFSGMSDNLVEDYRSDDYQKRKTYLKWMTDDLMGEDVTADYFTPELLAQSGGPVYTKVMRFKAFKEVYADPVNKPYFDGLSSMEKQLIKVRILDMADLYEKVLRFQCRCCGVVMDNGQFLKDDGELVAKPEELEAVHGFKEKIAYRNEQTRAIMAASYIAELTKEDRELEKQNQERKESIESGGEQELQGTGLTGFLVGYTPSTMNEIRQILMEKPESYEANKPLLDLMEQEFFRVIDAGSEYTRRTKAIDDIRSNIDPTGVQGTVAENEFIKFFTSESDKITLKQTVITNRLNTLREGMKAIVRGRKPEGENVKRVIEEFRHKLAGSDKAVMAQIDNATAGWVQRRLEEIPDEQWKLHERYDGTLDLKEYMNYMVGQGQKLYTRQISEKIGLERLLDEDVAAGIIKPMTHFVETRTGKVTGLNLSRMISNVEVLTATTDLTPEQARSMMRKMAAGESGPEGSEQKDRTTAEGLKEFKNTVYKHIKSMEARYGKMLTQLHPEDVLKRLNIHEFAMDARLIQDMVNLIDDNSTGIRLFENNPADEDYKALADYYFNAITVINNYVQIHSQNTQNEEMLAFQSNALAEQMEKARRYEEKVNGGPSLKASQMPYYVQSVRQRYQKSGDIVKRQGYGRW